MSEKACKVKWQETLKGFWWKVRIVEHQTKRPKQKVIVLRGKEPKIKSKRIRSTKTRKMHTWRKNGVSTTMKMSTKGPNEDYARLSCQHKERPQLVCQKRVSNRFVHLPRSALSALSSLFLGLQAWYSLWIGGLCIFFFSLFF